MGHARKLVSLIAAIALVLALAMLERQRAGVERSTLWVGPTPVTLLAAPQASGPLVIVAHGFAGSQQMMDAYALTLARAGYRVASFDFEGHGRNRAPMRGDVTKLEGTTALLVEELLRVERAAQDAFGGVEEVALLGHSMASDIVVRAAQSLGVQVVVGISAYSQAISATHPQALLLISGAGEPHLRAAAVRSAQMVDPAAAEGVTVQAGAVLRRAVVAPLVEHVGVLQSRTALREALGWLDARFGQANGGALIAPGPWMILALGGVLLLGSLAAGHRGAAPAPVPGNRRAVLLASGGALVASAGAVWLNPYDPLPMSVGDDLSLLLLVYGAVQLLARKGALRVEARGLAAVLIASALFALILDRYGASFVPSGPRWPVFAVLLPGALVFALADRRAASGQGIGLRLLLRLFPLAALVLAIFTAPGELFFLAVAVPVLGLFFLTFGWLGHAWAVRRGADGPGLALGVMLAWSLAAAVPLYLS